MEPDNEPLVLTPRFNARATLPVTPEPGPDCCCCDCCDICNCPGLKRNSRNQSCCCCLPLQVGIWLIVYTMVAIALIMSLEGFIYLHNQYIDSYFVAVYLCLLLPLYAGVILLVIYQNEEN